MSMPELDDLKPLLLRRRTVEKVLGVGRDKVRKLVRDGVLETVDLGPLHMITASSVKRAATPVTKET
jgi:hypothetical protein